MVGRVDGVSFLKQAVKHRLREPVDQMAFWALLVVGVLGMSALPVYIELFRYWQADWAAAESLQLALITFAYALGGVSALQMVMEKDYTPISNFGILVSAVMLVITLVLLSKFFPFPSWFISLSGVVLAVGAVLIWWIANGDTDAVKDKVKDEAAVGGKTNVTLPGSTDGYDL